jgi:DNA-directed RNA polymerase specialized sigma24 family protein
MLRDWSKGDKKAHDQLFRAVYNELHCKAAGHLQHEHPGLSLQATDLLDEALIQLAAIDPQQSQIVELRFFSRLSVEEIAKVLDVSERTVKRDWNVNGLSVSSDGRYALIPMVDPFVCDLMLVEDFH